MKVLEYLKTHSIEQLREEYNIKAREYDNGLVCLNYDQIESIKFDPIVCECRGLIINLNTLKPVSRTFERFFNVGENPNDPFDYSSFRAEEKADGSLMSVYWHDRKWNVASRGTTQAEGTTSSGVVFRDLFIDAIGGDLDDFMKDMFRNQSYTFELCSLDNKVVKMYKEPVVYLLNVVNLVSGEEGDVLNLLYIAETLGVKRPDTYDRYSIDEIKASFDSFEPTDEGYVLIDDNGNRVKIKNPKYVELHHLSNNGELTPRRICDVVFRGEVEEVLSYFPELADRFKVWEDAYIRMGVEISRNMFLVADKSMTQKEFALSIKDLHCKSIMFGLRKGLTISEIIGNMSINTRVAILRQYKKGDKNEC